MCPFPYLFSRIFILPVVRHYLIKEELGRENIARDTPYIFAVNHNSHLDEFVTMPAIMMSSRRKRPFTETGSILRPGWRG